jgi:hypothetical protein
MRLLGFGKQCYHVHCDKRCLSCAIQWVLSDPEPPDATGRFRARKLQLFPLTSNGAGSLRVQSLAETNLAAVSVDYLLAA